MTDATRDPTVVTDDPTGEPADPTDDATDAPTTPHAAEDAAGARAGRVARLTRTAEESRHRAEQWLEERRATAVPVDMAVHLYERDRDVFASVLGAAIALRLFLFMVAASAAFVGLFLLVLGHGAFDSLLDQGNVTGEMAKQISDSLNASKSTGVAVLVGGVWLTLTTGRSLTAVLAACSAGAWGMEGRRGKASLKVAAAVTTLIGVLFVAGMVLNRIRSAFGPGVATGSLVLAAVVYGIGWFVVTWTLPRDTHDPGALLPGAALVGVTLSLLQWFMQFYLPRKISEASQVSGSLGFAVAVLGYMFLIGRVMAVSFVVDAVVWDRLGSLSRPLFALPVIRHLPARFPKLVTFFDLEAASPGPGEETTGAVGHDLVRTEGDDDLMTDTAAHGPIDYVLLEFPEQQLAKDTVDAVLDLVDGRVVYLYDVLVARRAADGSVAEVDLHALGADELGGLAALAGAQSGLLNDDDLAEVGGVLDPGSLGLLLVFENAWAAPFIGAALRSGGQLIASQRIPALEVKEALDAADAAS